MLEQIIRIEGHRIILRPMEYGDTERIVKWRNSERVRSRFIYRETFTTRGHCRWIETMIDTGKAVQFMICEKEGIRPVGSVYFRDIDREKKEAEYGIFLGEDDALGKGYGTEAARLAVEYAFSKMGLERLILRVFTDNGTAVRSYEKAGFREEKILKDVECSDGERKDMLLMSLKKKKSVSFVIPCYRSELTLPKVIEEIGRTMEDLRKQGREYSYEIILVNDCSPDDTFSVIRKFCQEDKRIKGVNLARNFGQHAALMAGFHQVRGDVVICLDDDGQTPADEAGKLLEEIEKGSDVVYAKYEHKKHSLFRNFGSWVSNVTVCHREREIGTSGYTLGKLIGLWFNGFTAFSVKPLRLATALGIVCSAGGFLYGIYTVVKKLVNPNVPMGFSSLMAAVVFMGGMMMVMLGLVGEYVGRMYISMNSSPQFVIRETVNEEI